RRRRDGRAEVLRRADGAPRPRGRPRRAVRQDPVAGREEEARGSVPDEDARRVVRAARRDRRVLRAGAHAARGARSPAQPCPGHVRRARRRAPARPRPPVQPQRRTHAGAGDAPGRRHRRGARRLGIRRRRGGAVARPRRGALRNATMPIPEQRDLDKAREVIRDWLAAKLPDARDLTISTLASPAFTGFSNETLLFDASWREGGETRSAGFVIRVKPTSHTIFLEADFDSQYKVIKALSGHTDVPLPPVHWFEDDESVLGAPFFVMGKVEGHVPSDNPPYTQTGWLLEEATPAVRGRVVWSGLE